MNPQIKPADGKLGILVVGINGAVATTFISGVISIRKGLSAPIGSLTQMATIRIGDRIENRFPLIKDFVPLVDLNDLVFAGWDIRDENLFQAASGNGVLKENDILPIKEELSALRPMKAVFDNKFVTRLHGEHIKSGKNKLELAEALREDIRNFKAANNLDRIVMIWCGSTEIYLQPYNSVYSNMEQFEEGLRSNSAAIAPSMIYAYAALKENIPYINGAPNLTVDIPAFTQYAEENCIPVCGKDFKTGQTMMKTVIAPMLKARMLGLKGWFSANILGNRDGEVLDDPDSFKTKEESKLSVIDSILQPEIYPALYKDYYHKVRIHYYPPKGDNKEGWDHLDIVGWMGYPMEIKINFLCRDSILAAPICLDLCLFMDLAQRTGMAGIQEWLSFYFKSPMHSPDIVPENDLFIQLMKLKNTLRELMGEEVITHLDKAEEKIAL